MKSNGIVIVEIYSRREEARCLVKKKTDESHIRPRVLQFNVFTLWFRIQWYCRDFYMLGKLKPPPLPMYVPTPSSPEPHKRQLLSPWLHHCRRKCKCQGYFFLPAPKVALSLFFKAGIFLLFLRRWMAPTSSSCWQSETERAAKETSFLSSSCCHFVLEGGKRLVGVCSRNWFRRPKISSGGGHRGRSDLWEPTPFMTRKEGIRESEETQKAKYRHREQSYPLLRVYAMLPK